MQLKHRDDECNDCSVQRPYGDRAADREPDHDRAATPNAIVGRLHPRGQLGERERRQRERGDMIELARAHDENERTRGEQERREPRGQVIVRSAEEPVQIARR